MDKASVALAATSDSLESALDRTLDDEYTAEKQYSIYHSLGEGRLAFGPLMAGRMADHRAVAVMLL